MLMAYVSVAPPVVGSLSCLVDIAEATAVPFTGAVPVAEYVEVTSFVFRSVFTVVVPMITSY